jgi:hypothetical protein
MPFDRRLESVLSTEGPGSDTHIWGLLWILTMPTTYLAFLHIVTEADEL